MSLLCNVGTHIIHDINIAAATFIPFIQFSLGILLDIEDSKLFKYISSVQCGCPVACKSGIVGGNQRGGAGHIRHHHCTCH